MRKQSHMHWAVMSVLFSLVLTVIGYRDVWEEQEHQGLMRKDRGLFSPRKIVSAGSSGHKKSDIFIVLLVDSSAEKDNI